MLNYTDEQIRSIIIEIFKMDCFELVPVGNHHLKRHLVYKITFDKGEKYIFKLYYKDRRRNREIAGLSLLSQSEVKCPKIYKYGNLEDGKEWLIMKCIDGFVFDKVLTSLSCENKEAIFQEMGEELGKVHAYRTFDYFGEWNEAGDFIYRTSNYYEAFIESSEKTFESILARELPDKEILIKAIKEIRDNYPIININFTPRLIHNDYDARNVLIIDDRGQYRLTGIIDFEGSYAWNAEEDLVGLYFKYFLTDTRLEKAFLFGYTKYNEIRNGFKERLYLYLLNFTVGNCTWAHYQAPDYYDENILFLRNLLI